MTEPLSRQETLSILRAMGVVIPETSVLPDDALDKRLKDALHAAQYKDRLPDPLNLQSLPEWPKPSPALAARRRGGDSGRDPTSLTNAMMRGNMHEMEQLDAAKRMDPNAAENLYMNPFICLRMVLTEVVKFCDYGSGWAVVDEGLMEEFVAIRVVSIRKMHNRGPVLVVLYRAFSKEQKRESMKWCHRQSKDSPLDPRAPSRLNRFSTTAVSRKLLLQLLKLNEPLVPKDFPIERKPDEADFKVSMLLSVGPLEQQSLAKLNNNFGCAVCGKEGASRCSRCQIVRYCSSDCQRADWKNHKPDCVPLINGRWCSIRATGDLASAIPELRGSSADRRNWQTMTINRHANLIDPDPCPQKRTRNLSSVPPNAWGEKPFVVKFQAGMQHMPMHLMMYDRKRSFQVFFVQQDDPTLFAEFLAEVRRPRGGHEGLKMYRWARRTGDWTFNVCLDRAPTTGTQW
ncbi:uncharacterized protein BXZ73DRAFT_50096 [Epithele typhae]|uniref:uncharacterized protein n=1 Tax=Epithele typhae TaxID=378194 RepID=UPI0020080B4F|nr:uncharacterized protein BXZ73DRAFT_50096 [Epithele typhae]KAH9925057.1 hypothetical protein BXZ73DRAFT_50096 [Epithele typhae]